MKEKKDSYCEFIGVSFVEGVFDFQSYTPSTEVGRGWG
jgi:hypothetical protein